MSSLGSYKCQKVLFLTLWHIFFPVAVVLPYVLGQNRANSLDPDQTPQNAASDLGFHCLPLIQVLDK